MEPSSRSPQAAATASKRPPPEKPESISLRTKVVFAFWAVILFLGLPTWYQTTSIYRARLPLQEMLQLADGLNDLPIVPLQIWIYAPDLVCFEAQRIVQETQASLDDLNEFPILHQRLRLVHDSTKNHEEQAHSCGEDVQSLKGSVPALEVVLQSHGNTFSFTLHQRTSYATANIPTPVRSQFSTDLAKSLQSLFSSEQIATALQIIAHTTNNQQAHAFLKSQSQDAANDIHKQLSRAAKSSPTYHLTFSLFTAGGAPSSWDIHDMLATHIQPLVHGLVNTSEIAIATQIQLYSSFSPSIQTFQVEGHEGALISQNDLTAFVNAAEWPLSPSIGTGPTLNFIVFVPPREQIPLNIEGHGGTSWLIPQWGSIKILNPPLLPHPINGVLTVPGSLSADLLSSSFETFAAHLLSLLGVLSFEFQGQASPLPLRLQAHQRLSAFALHMKAGSSLGSLARLAQRLSSIPIPKHVAQLVENAMGNLTASNSAFSDGRWSDAVRYASSAYQDSEKAFFDKSMVGQVYFPDEHKVAVYLPLLGPIGVPLAVGLVREIKRLVAGFKSTKI